MAPLAGDKRKLRDWPKAVLLRQCDERTIVTACPAASRLHAVPPPSIIGNGGGRHDVARYRRCFLPMCMNPLGRS